jgi:DNA polymerase
LVSLDFETYYDDDYSLRKMTTLEYVQHPKFKAQSVSVRIDRVVEGHLMRGDIRYFPTVQEAMDELAALDKWVMIGQNTKFDGYICHYHYNVHPTVYADTKSMSKGIWPFESASLESMAKRLWPQDHTMRKGQDLIQSKGILDWSTELHEIIGVYCKQDSFLTAEAFWRMFNMMPSEELEIIHITMRMVCYPVMQANHAILEEAAQDELDERERVAQRAIDMINDLVTLKGLEYWNPDEKEAKKLKPLDTMVLSSRNRFIKVLIELCGIELPMKTKARKDGSTYKTEATAKNDPEYLDLVADNPDLSLLFEAREIFASNQALSRARRMKAISKPDRNCEIPVPLGYYNAHTGRYGGEEKLNMQNLGRGSKHRLALHAPDGYMTFVADSSNVEARTNAGFCGQEDLLEAFRRGEDVYSEFATDVYDRKITKKTDPDERNVGKVCVLGLGYGMGSPTLRRTFASGPMGMAPIKFPVPMCDKMVNTYRAANYMIVAGWKQAGRMIEAMITIRDGETIDWGPLKVMKDRILLPNGMYLNYPKVQYNDNLKSFAYWNGMYWKRIYGGALIENIIQALARIVVMSQCTKIDRLLQHFGGWIVMQVHDENIGVAIDMGQEQNDQLFEAINDLMRVPPTWMPELPLDSEGGWAKNYSK